MQMRTKNIGVDKAWEKARHFCAYQERNHREVKEKLYSFGLYKEEVEQLLSKLIEENFLNEERYALAFAGGKFRMNSWGRIKITHALREKQLRAYCIRMAISAIDEDQYLRRLHQLASAKQQELQQRYQGWQLNQKIFQYLLQKGYEKELIKNCIEILPISKA
jgi:regulatory protein